MNAKHGVITDSKWYSRNSDSMGQGLDEITIDRVNGQQLHKIHDWASCLQGSAPAVAGDSEKAQITSLTSELDHLLPALPSTQ